jgi:hypothetical protein
LVLQLSDESMLALPLVRAERIGIGTCSRQHDKAPGHGFLDYICSDHAPASLRLHTAAS